jgi:hypothetical protein
MKCFIAQSVQHEVRRDLVLMLCNVGIQQVSICSTKDDIYSSIPHDVLRLIRLMATAKHLYRNITFAARGWHSRQRT